MTSQQRSEETYTRILEVAAACFAERGYDAASVAEICQRAGVSKGAFYYHFPTKQALFLRLLQGWLEGLDARMVALSAAAATVPDALLHMAVAFQDIFQPTDGQQLSIFLEFLRQAQRDPEVWEATIEPYRRYRELFATLIAAGITEGSLRPVDPTMAAQHIVSLAVGLLVQSVLDPRGGDWGKVAQASIQMLLAGLRQEYT